jgi:glutamine amidotransferase
VHSDDLAGHPAVVLASERMDDDPAWRLLAGGELLHVDARLAVSSTIAVDHPPRHPLTLADLAPNAAVSRPAPAPPATGS